MKKVILVLCLLVSALPFITACSTGDSDDRTIIHFLQAFENGGFDTSNRQVPFFQMIGANDGMQFVIDGYFHSVYAFENINALEQAFADNPFMETQGWITNGRFAIHSSIGEINEFFRNIE